ncbi:hypothetical protein QYM36_010845 [Artemia franciscana]|uniref:Uncharacterized protein n=1 Tax=Artemia franciscana TaxID=6661 RepID=A0AA88L8L2_ARTSF|nr:hypothetical protein QYM36_010845 [Artemia franciscana]
MEANLLSYDIKRLKTSESTTKGVNHAYRECASSPDIYFQFHKKQATNSPVKQDPGADLGTTVLDVAKKMATYVQKEQVLSVNSLRLTNATANIQTPTPIAPVLDKFVTKNMAYTVFKAKNSKLKFLGR